MCYAFNKTAASVPFNARFASTSCPGKVFFFFATDRMRKWKQAQKNTGAAREISEFFSKHSNEKNVVLLVI